ncbi:chitinase [Cryobacterium roopkundense]|uniref:Chitinase n=1 Tax=Cryobacterium roopkundense TaxID=1001240 RepID=A0A7W9E3Z3_9MICO|nr:chitinase [Cryobacterium roopkundense]MBB5640420.1 chitinase [Cryobacterium roopkundense]
MAPTSPSANRDASRRHLSIPRLIIAVVVVGALGVGGFMTVSSWGAARAAASVDPWFAGYADVTATPSLAFESPANTAGRDVVLSFIVAGTDTPCTPSWGTFYSLQEAAEALDLDRRVARVKQLGGEVVVSFGGAINDELSTSCTEPKKLVSAYTDVLDYYDVSTIDLDVEAANLTDAAAGERRAAAIATLQANRRDDEKPLAVWLTLPVAPSGLTEDGTTAVAQMLEAGVDLAGVNVMTMDYGDRDDSETMAETSISALTATHQQLLTLYQRADMPLTDATVWTKMGATPMIGQNDVRAEVFTLEDAADLQAFATQKKLARLSMWSLNRDRTCSANYADLTRVSDSCSGIEQNGASFATILGDGLTGRPQAGGLKTTTPEPIAEVAVDDPATSPYPIWATEGTYVKDTKIVWHGNVYQAKYWTQGDLPDDPVLQSTETPWTLIGPVLPGDAPYVQPSLPVGTYPAWDGATVYRDGDRVLLGTVPFEAKYYSQGDSPEAAALSPDSSPWRALTAAEIAAVESSTVDGGAEGGTAVATE